ncbi:MAG: MOSC domain-containing protein [Xanthomonadaceae bacterium]|nr:MOSC domain-containing protein [Xanthomonadaceae bacterium]MDE2245752.1 MOSC domain-containing protein [Xanthomonadaceae bacterium]
MTMSTDAALRELAANFPRAGTLRWIGLRPASGVRMSAVASVEARAGAGLAGDRHHGSGRRQVTLIQAEHLPAIAALTGHAAVDPAWLRRNLLVAGINVQALVTAHFRIGDVLLQGSGPCEPCARMEQALGAGGCAAMTGHGGITARILEGGMLHVGDPVRFVALD